MRTTTRLAVGVVLAAVCAACLRADEQAVPLDKVPKAVLDAVKKRFPKAELVEAAKETEGDKVEYEVSLKDGGTKCDVMLTPEGVITLIEKQITAEDLPKAVTKAVEAKYPKAAFKVVEEMTVVKDGKESVGYYEVLLVTADKKTVEVEVAPDGTFKAVEEKKAEGKD